MAIKKAISGYRSVTIAFDDAAGQDIVAQTAQIAAPINAFKAALAKVEEIEGQYAKSGAKDVTVHSLRHSIATHLLQQGMSLDHIRQFLGHSSLETTGKYVHIKMLIEQEEYGEL